MDPYTIACLSADPSWRRDDDPFTKEAAPLFASIAQHGLRPTLAYGAKAFGRGWKGMGNLRKAEKIENLAMGRPWYKSLPFMPKTTPMSALSNPTYQAAHRATNVAREVNRLNSKGSLPYRLGSLGRAGGGLAAATMTPLAYTQAGMSPVLQERQYAHGYTDSATRIGEEFSNMPWWKVMGIGLGKAFDKDILWNNFIDPIAGRGYWESLKGGFDTKGIRGAWDETAKTFGAREALRKRDQIRALEKHPGRLQSVIDDLTAYQKAVIDAQAAQQTQS